MRAPRRAQLTPREISILISAGLAGALVLGALIAANAQWSGMLPGGGGFYSIWAAVRQFLVQHADPYGASSAAQAQELVYGGGATSIQNPYRLDLPFFLLPLYFGFGLIPDAAAARGLWATLAQVTLIGATLICARLADWHPPRLLMLGLTLLVFLSFPVVAALVEGTLTTLLLFAYVAILLAMKTGRDELAGAFAVLALCKWEVGLPFMLILTLRIVQDRRWRIAAGFGMTMTILLLVAFLLYPGWLMPFLVGTVAMMRSGHGISMQSALGELIPANAPNVALGITAVILVLLVVEVLGGRRSGFRRFVWTACLALAATPLLGFRSDMANLIGVVPGIVLIAASGSNRRASGAWISLGLIALQVGMPWILGSTPLMTASRRADAIVFLLIPAVCVLGMYWTRWWYLRPTRTWMDEIREAR